MDTKVENYREHVEALSSMMINLLNDSESLHERILILCKYEKYKADFITFNFVTNTSFYLDFKLSI